MEWISQLGNCAVLRLLLLCLTPTAHAEGLCPIGAHEKITDARLPEKPIISLELIQTVATKTRQKPEGKSPVIFGFNISITSFSIANVGRGVPHTIHFSTHNNEISCSSIWIISTWSYHSSLPFKTASIWDANPKCGCNPTLSSVICWNVLELGRRPCSSVYHYQEWFL